MRVGRAARLAPRLVELALQPLGRGADLRSQPLAASAELVAQPLARGLDLRPQALLQLLARRRQLSLELQRHLLARAARLLVQLRVPAQLLLKARVCPGQG